MDYLDAALWYASWPILVYLAYRFVLLNLRHHTKMERLEMLEEQYSKQDRDKTHMTQNPA